MEFKEATREDIKIINGGAETFVEYDERHDVWYITHYLPDETRQEIPTSNHNIDDWKPTPVRVPGTNKIVLVHPAVIKAFHGDPCERSSRQMGGESYCRF